MEYDELSDSEKRKISVALTCMGFPQSEAESVDICENGEVWVGLVQILPRESVKAACDD